ETSAQLIYLVDKFSSKNLGGMLISGGFTQEGILVVDNVLEGIKKIKEEKPHLKILVHAGFVDSPTAQALKNSGVDGVLTNLIASREAISKIYNLKNRQPRHFYKTIDTLKNHGLKVSPHIILGIDAGRMDREFGAVKKAISLGADSLVFVVMKKIPKASFDPPSVDDKKIIELVSYARELAPSLPLCFGCAKPPGKKTEGLEKSLIGVGIDSIGFPSEKTIEYAKENKIAFVFREKCCAVL
ncbi:MAG: hypothetical protein ACQEP5_08890, partial [Actinomycetota bacterium]